MRPWIATTFALFVMASAVPSSAHDTFSLLAFGYGGFTLMVVLPVWCVIQVAKALLRHRVPQPRILPAV